MGAQRPAAAPRGARRAHTLLTRNVRKEEGVARVARAAQRHVEERNQVEDVRLAAQQRHRELEDAVLARDAGVARDDVWRALAGFGRRDVRRIARLALAAVGALRRRRARELRVPPREDGCNLRRRRDDLARPSVQAVAVPRGDLHLERLELPNEQFHVRVHKEALSLRHEAIKARAPGDVRRRLARRRALRSWRRARARRGGRRARGVRTHAGAERRVRRGRAARRGGHTRARCGRCGCGTRRTA